MSGAGWLRASPASGPLRNLVAKDLTLVQHLHWGGARFKAFFFFFIFIVFSEILVTPNHFPLNLVRSLLKDLRGVVRLPQKPVGSHRLSEQLLRVVLLELLQSELWEGAGPRLL